MLENAAVNPALNTRHRDAARELASAYLADTAKSSGDVVSQAEFQAALDDVIANDAVMKRHSVVTDLPPGNWTAALIGAWWPASSTTLRVGAQHWSVWMMRKQELAHLSQVSPAIS
ncbi:hypothetical protein [Mycobacterium marinum]|uniref:hypothetical protein n=1 Tax=Mycobacterium marinum TaxID=1781 RepID=UPI00356386E3